MMDGWFLRGLMVALIFGVPAGAIGALVLERTLRGGFAAGLLTGLGSAAADVLYASLGVFGITLVSDFLLRYQGVIRLVGGALLALLGALVFAKRPRAAAATDDARRLPVCFLSSFAIAAANPATILAFVAAFAALGIAEKPAAGQGAALLCGIALGAALWWTALAGLAAIFRGKLKGRAQAWLNRALGLLIIAFGLYSAAGALM